MTTPAWTRKEGKNPKGGLNDKGREGTGMKAPVRSGDNPRRASFLARMGNMKGPERDEKGKPTRLLLSLKVWGASSKADARAKARAISKRNKAKKGKDGTTSAADAKGTTALRFLSRAASKNGARRTRCSAHVALRSECFT